MLLHHFVIFLGSDERNNALTYTTCKLSNSSVITQVAQKGRGIKNWFWLYFARCLANALLSMKHVQEFSVFPWFSTQTTYYKCSDSLRDCKSGLSQSSRSDERSWLIILGVSWLAIGFEVPIRSPILDDCDILVLSLRRKPFRSVFNSFSLGTWMVCLHCRENNDAKALAGGFE